MQPLRVKTYQQHVDSLNTHFVVSFHFVWSLHMVTSQAGWFVLQPWHHFVEYGRSLYVKRRKNPPAGGDHWLPPHATVSQVRGRALCLWGWFCPSLRGAVLEALSRRGPFNRGSWQLGDDQSYLKGIWALENTWFGRWFPTRKYYIVFFCTSTLILSGAARLYIYI